MAMTGITRLNESMMTNRRSPNLLGVQEKFGRAVHAQPLLPAAVAYLTSEVTAQEFS
jgi:hypothetical protein